MGVSDERRQTVLLVIMDGMNLMLSIGSACRNLKRPNHSIRSGQSDDISGVSENVEEQIWVEKGVVRYKRKADNGYSLCGDLT